MKIYKTLLALVLTAALTAGLFGCAKENAASQVFEYGGSAQTQAFDSGKKALHTQTKPREKLVKISKKETSVLYFDKQTFSVSLYDSNSKKLWNSLPEKYVPSKERPAVISVDVSAGGKTYTLNSQDDSVAEKKAKYEIKNGAVTVKYGFEKTLGKTKVSFIIPAVFSVKGGVLTASVDFSGVSAKGAVIKTVRLLPFFGATDKSEEDGALFVPDGCGALLNLSKEEKALAPVTVPLYGADFASGEKTGKYNAAAPCFGIISKNSAFAAVIEGGDAVSHITAERADKKSGYNRTGAGFDITKMYTDSESGKAYAAKNSFDGAISVSYRFLSGDNANYAGMAGACREALMRNGTLGFSAADESGSLPFILSIPGSVSDEKGAVTALTGYSEALEMLSVFRGKGIGSILLRYRGMFPQSAPDKLKTSKKLGSQKELEALCAYADTQDVTLFPDVSLFSAERGVLSKKAVSINSDYASAKTAFLPSSAIYAEREAELSPVSAFEKNTGKALSVLRGMPFEGVCAADAGRLLYSDYAEKNPADRQQAKEKAASQLNALSANSKLMVDYGNIYSLKYASAAVNLPSESQLAKTGGCREIPFLQILLHGLCDYAGKPLNLYKNTDNGLLKAAAFGEVPYFELYYVDGGTDKKPDPYYYMNFASEAQLSYERMSRTFASLRDKTITAHYEVKPNVTCTEYGGSAMVYVNYTNKDVTVNGVTISARDFIKVG